jgi:hypothetical protein
VPSRFGVPRGSLPRILQEAGEIADARMRTVMRYLDEYTALERPERSLGGGGRLTRPQFRQLLVGNPDFQQAVANRWLFSDQREKDALLRQLRELFPEASGPTVSSIPGTAIPPQEQGTGLGGPPQGAAPVGPGPVPGLAPAPLAPLLPAAPPPILPALAPGPPPMGVMPAGPLPLPPGAAVPLAGPGGPPGSLPPLPLPPGPPPGPLPPTVPPPLRASPPIVLPGAPAPSLAARLV